MGINSRSTGEARSPIGRGVIGILEDAGRFLMIRRAQYVTRPGTWCFPGGHINPDETTRQAVIRELHEELNIIVSAHRKLGYVRVIEYGYILAAWRVTLVEGEITPNPQEVAEARWCSPADMRTVQPALASNEIVFEMLGI
ncbi:MAG: NUDIX hydrolase [Planctomycetota bacterium]|jgi:8-oxo-dGTP diphosphatase